MAITSRLGAAEDGLFTIVSARPALSGVAIDRMHPGNELRREHIWIVEDDSADQEWETTGMGSQIKREELRLAVALRATDVEYQAARDRALVLAGEVEAAVRADFKLSNSVWDADVQGIDKRAAELTDEGWLVEIRVRIRARAFLS